LRRYRDFCDFHDYGRRHLGFGKIRYFNGLTPVGGQFTSPCQNSAKKGQTVAAIWLFNRFSKWRPSAILDFGNSNFLTIWAVKGPILYNPAEFREDGSIRCCDIAIFVVFHDGCRCNLGF